MAAPDARVLILGSMPGEASLAAQQYYAHPRNAFWPIMGALLGFDAALPYVARLTCLTRSGIAMWDVLAACRRSGSLDSAIEADSIEPNDFTAFLRDHTGVRGVLFNGGAAEMLFRRQVLPSLPDEFAVLPCTRLPSTSPAHAAKGFGEKCAAWRIALCEAGIAVGCGNRQA